MQGFAVGLLGALALLVAPTAAQAIAPTSYTVTGTADGAPGTCTPSSTTAGQDVCTTLRAAIQTANTNGGNPTIQLGAGNYTLGGAGGTSLELRITTSLALRGQGPAATQITQTDGSHNVIIVQPGTVTISGTTIQGGVGTGVHNFGTLTLDGDVIQGNHYTGAHVPPGTGSTFAATGGGIANTFNGRLTLVRSLVTGNAHTGGNADTESGGIAASAGETGLGGGIYSDGLSVVIRESTISGNTATGGNGGNGTAHGAGAGGPGEGAGLYVQGTGSVTVVNSTIAGNIAQGGARGTGAVGDGFFASTWGAGITLGTTGAITLQNDTIAGNVASQMNGASADAGNIFEFSGGAFPTINDSIIAGGQANPSDPSHVNCDFVLSAPTAGSGHNLEDTAAGASGCGLVAAAANVFVARGAAGLAAVPGANGGPTPTIALQTGSAALGAGGACTDPLSTPPGQPLGTDQRGLPRPAGAACDIGAYQVQSVALTRAPSLRAEGRGFRCVDFTFSGDGLAYAFAWKRDGALIPGAAAATYTPGTADVGRGLTCRVTATGARGSASSESAAVVVHGTPVISNLRQSASQWRRGTTLPHAARRHSRPPVGTVFSFTLNESARVTLTFTTSGRRVGRRCVRPTTGNRRHRACTITAGALSFDLARGPHRISFAGRLSRRSRLAVGSYTLVVTAASGGVRSTAHRLGFTIAPR